MAPRAASTIFICILASRAGTEAQLPGGTRPKVRREKLASRRGSQKSLRLLHAAFIPGLVCTSQEPCQTQSGLFPMFRQIGVQKGEVVVGPSGECEEQRRYHEAPSCCWGHSIFITAGLHAHRLSFSLRPQKTRSGDARHAAVFRQRRLGLGP